MCNKYKLIQLTDYIEEELAIKKENEYVKKYKNDGWEILNKIKTGSVGGLYNGKHTTYWTKERCKDESIKYKSRYSFQKNSGSAYSSAFKNGWLDEICSHIVNRKYSTSF